MQLQRKISLTVILLLITCTLPSFGNGDWDEPSAGYIPSEAFINENASFRYEESNPNFRATADVLDNGNSVNPNNTGDDGEIPPPLTPIGSGEGILIAAVLVYLFVLVRRQRQPEIKN